MSSDFEPNMEIESLKQIIERSLKERATKVGKQKQSNETVWFFKYVTYLGKLKQITSLPEQERLSKMIVNKAWQGRLEVSLNHVREFTLQDLFDKESWNRLAKARQSYTKILETASKNGRRDHHNQNHITKDYTAFVTFKIFDEILLWFVQELETYFEAKDMKSFIAEYIRRDKEQDTTVPATTPPNPPAALNLNPLTPTPSPTEDPTTNESAPPASKRPKVDDCTHMEVDIEAEKCCGSNDQGFITEVFEQKDLPEDSAQMNIECLTAPQLQQIQYSGSKVTSTTSNGAGDIPRCVSCLSSEVAQIKRDGNFNKVIRYYWDAMTIEVKPLEYQAHDTCKPCFKKLVHLYDSNALIRLLEKKFTTLENEFIGKTVMKLEKLEANGKNKNYQSLGKLQEAVLEKWRNASKLPTPLEDPFTGSVEITDQPSESESPRIVNVKAKPNLPKPQSKQKPRKGIQEPETSDEDDEEEMEIDDSDTSISENDFDSNASDE